MATMNLDAWSFYVTRMTGGILITLSQCFKVTSIEQALWKRRVVNYQLSSTSSVWLVHILLHLKTVSKS